MARRWPERDLPAATVAFERAVEMDTQQVDGWIMPARVHAATGDRDKVIEALEHAASNNPDNQALKAALTEFN